MICPKCGYKLRFISEHTTGSSLTGSPSHSVGCSCVLCGYWREVERNAEKPMPEKPVINKNDAQKEDNDMLIIDMLRPLYHEIHSLREDRMPWKGIIRRLNLTVTYDSLLTNYQKLKRSMAEEEKAQCNMIHI